MYRIDYRARDNEYLYSVEFPTIPDVIVEFAMSGILNAVVTLPNGSTQSRRTFIMNNIFGCGTA